MTAAGVAGGADVLSLYAGAPLGTRISAAIDWLRRPYSELGAVVAAEGPVLVVGAGLGVFACHLALAAPAREVLGIDTDPRRVARARLAGRQVQARSGRCRFELSPPGEVPGGPWSTVVLVGCLEELEVGARGPMLAACAAMLAPRGLVVVAGLTREGALSAAGALESSGLEVSRSWVGSVPGRRLAVVEGRSPGLRAVG